MINSNYLAAESQDRNYSKKLLRVRTLLSNIGIRCSINMFRNLMFSVQHPVDRFDIGVVVTEYNSQDLIIRAPLLGHSLLFEHCNAQTFVNALVAAKLIPGPSPLFADVDEFPEPPDPSRITPDLSRFYSEAFASGHGDE